MVRLLLVALLPLVASCSRSGDGASKVCTQKACSPSAVVTTRVAPGDAADGEHAFTIEADGETRRCTVRLAAPQRPEFAKCDGNVQLSLGPKMRGQEVASPVPGTVGYTEVPVAGEFEWCAAVYGQPKKLRIVHAFQGRTVVDRTTTPQYADTWPNGPGCEPACPTSSESWK